MLHQAVLTPSSLLQQSLNLESQLELLLTLKVTLGEMNSFSHAKRKLKTTSPHEQLLYTLTSTIFTLEKSSLLCDLVILSDLAEASLTRLWYSTRNVLSCSKKSSTSYKKKRTIKKTGFHSLSTEQLQSKFAHFTVAVMGNAAVFIV